MVKQEFFEEKSAWKVTNGLGHVRWFNKNWALHRIDGPAIEMKHGRREWYYEGKLHRIDGPAVELGTKYKFWYQMGELHRICGPAIHTINETSFYLRGERFPTKEAFFEALTPEEKSIALFSEDFLNA